MARASRAGGAAPRGAPTGFVVGFLGGLQRWHGVETLLEAFRQLRETSLAYRLLSWGMALAEPCRAPSCRAAASRSRAKCPHRDVPGCLEPGHRARALPAAAAVLLLPLKVLEYAASGVPVVASASGQIAEIFAHETSAMLHAPGIVAHVERPRTSPEPRIRVARAARRAVKKVYTWDRLAAHLLAIADSACRPSSKAQG